MCNRGRGFRRRLTEWPREPDDSATSPSPPPGVNPSVSFSRMVGVLELPATGAVRLNNAFCGADTVTADDAAPGGSTAVLMGGLTVMS